MDNAKKIYLAGGCFWCIEAVFDQFRGIRKTVSGYAGGAVEDPSYEQVSHENTGHAETVEVSYDPEQISLEQILEIFWTAHDPTTKDRQGNDVGSQYRSVVFYNTDEEKAAIEKSITEVATKLWDDPIVTEVLKLEKFYPAEEYHQDYYKNNPNAGYCQVVINPKLKKTKEKFAQLLK